MKLQMTRTLFRGNETLEQGQIVEIPDDEVPWWIEREYAVHIPQKYQTKPHIARPTLAGGEVKPSSVSPPARRSRKRKLKPAEDDAQL
jgi:hypothetical protein